MLFGQTPSVPGLERWFHPLSIINYQLMGERCFSRCFKIFQVLCLSEISRSCLHWQSWIIRPMQGEKLSSKMACKCRVRMFARLSARLLDCPAKSRGVPARISIRKCRDSQASGMAGWGREIESPGRTLRSQPTPHRHRIEKFEKIIRFPNPQWTNKL